MKRYNITVVILLVISLLILVGCNSQADDNDSSANISINGQGIVGDESGNAAAEGLSGQNDANEDVGSQAAEGNENAGDAAEDASGDDTFAIDREAILTNITASMEKEFSEVPDQYLIGWTYSLKISGISEDLLSTLDMNSLFESMVVAKEFQYNVGNPLQVAYTPTGIYMTVGKVNEIADPFASQTSVSATNSSQSVSHKGPEDIVFSNDQVVVQIASIITTSHEVEFTEDVEIEGWDTVNGTINFKRLGPGSSDNQRDIDLDASVENGIVTGIIPQGDYALIFKRDDFSLEVPIDPDYIFITEGHEPITIKTMKTVTGAVYKGSETNDDKQPVEGAVVELIPLITDAGIEGDFIDETDSDGNYSIDDVPLGVYQVVVNGVPQHKVTINTVGNGENPTEDIYLPGNIFDVTIHMDMIRSTVEMTFNEVYIGDDYSTSVNMMNGVYTLVKGGDVYPNSTAILSLTVPAYAEY
ncbi:MAG: carboxypeptidase-like regulatory domain-containing protein [Vallitaleaceae bacterium]|jgi:hypothetical protein|nr:carboxypeptidase-like regulatory domain-containing protein [Vallitaleaceae bacterium]